MTTTRIQKPMSVHVGGALRGAARTYPTLRRAIIEIIQNAVDAGARTIRVLIDKKKRRIIVTDDGRGITEATFDSALQSVYHSIKVAGAIGRFGLGLMSPLDKCKRFTFTTVPPGEQAGYIEWVFDPERMLAAEDGLMIECIRHAGWRQVHRSEERPDWGHHSWRSRLEVTDYVEDRSIVKLTMNELSVAILDEFNERMKKQDTMVLIEMIEKDGSHGQSAVHPRSYSGRRLPERTITRPDCGRVVFRLYESPVTGRGRIGAVHVGLLHEDVRMTFKAFVATCKTYDQTYLDADTMEGLGSGAFEGEILVEHAELRPDRRGFIEDPMLLELCIAIDHWYATEGAAVMDELREGKSDSRFERNAKRSLQVIDSLIDESPELLDLVKRFKHGHIGKGHAKPLEGRLTTQLTAPAIAITGGGSANGSGNSGPSGGSANAKEAVQHRPSAVAGPSGKPRVRVQGGSKGLIFMKVAIPDSETVCQLDLSVGEIRFNYLHELWAACDQNDRMQMAYMEYVAIQTLWLYTIPVEGRDAAKDLLYNVLRSYVHQLTKGDKVAGRTVKK